MKKILTPAGKRKKREYNTIIKLYNELREDQEEATPNSLYTQISIKVGCSLNKVRNVILQYNHQDQ